MILASVFTLTANYLKQYYASANQNYTLKAYKNTVALYNGEEIVKIYDDVVLNTLPEKDIYLFKSGLSVTSPEQADCYLEDFDS